MRLRLPFYPSVWMLCTGHVAQTGEELFAVAARHPVSPEAAMPLPFPLVVMNASSHRDCQSDLFVFRWQDPPALHESLFLLFVACPSQKDAAEPGKQAEMFFGPGRHTADLAVCQPTGKGIMPTGIR